MIKTGNRNFWIIQSISWGALMLLNFILQTASGYPAKLGLMNSITVFPIFFLITSGYRMVIKKLNLNLFNFGRTVLIILLSSALLTIITIIITNLIIRYVFVYRGLTPEEIMMNAPNFAIMLIVWNVLYFMIHYLHNWKNAESEKWQLAAAVKEAELGNLKSQINPHFIFNALNNIRALISEDPDKARNMITKFSDLFRYSLLHTAKEEVKLSEEIDIVEDYLTLLSIQFEERLQYKIKVDKDLMDEMIPPMILQLLVENSIKHGISEIPEGGEVEIWITKGDQYLCIQVRNTTNKYSVNKIEQKLGIGLSNLKNRIQLYYGKAATVELLEDPTFTTALVKIPIG